MMVDTMMMIPTTTTTFIILSSYIIKLSSATFITPLVTIDSRTTTTSNRLLPPHPKNPLITPPTSHHPFSHTTTTPTHLTATKRYKNNSPQWNDDDEYRIRSRAASKNSGTGELAAGLVLGGLLGGPFGALFGAQIGASLGSKRAVDRERKEEMERMGITEEMLQMAEECGVALERGIEGLKATEESLSTQQTIALRLESEINTLYSRATTALQSSDESQARSLLLERERLTKRYKTVLQGCASEKKRVEQMTRNVEALERRAMEVDGLLRRSVGAKGLRDANGGGGWELEEEDPLLKKFRDLERGG